MGRFGAASLLLITFCISANAKERLVLIGGGPFYNEKAIAQFVTWMEETGGKVLRISWASGIPVPLAAAQQRDSTPFPKGERDRSPFPP